MKALAFSPPWLPWPSGLRWSRSVTRARHLPLTGLLLAAGLLAVAFAAFLGVLRAPVFVDEADNVLNACLTSQGFVAYRDFFSHHFPAPYYLPAALGGGAACSVLVSRVVGVVLLVAAGALFAWVTRNPLAPLALILVALSAPAYYAQLYLAETYLSAGLIGTLGLLTDRGRRLGGPVSHLLRFLALTVLVSSSPLGLMMALVAIPLMLLWAGDDRWKVAAVCTAAVLIWPAMLAAQGTLPLFVEQAILFNTQVYASYLDVQLTSPLALSWQALTFFRHRFSFAMDWLIGQETKAVVDSFASGLELLLVGLLAVLAVTRSGERPFRLGVLLLTPLAVSRDGFHLSPFVALASFGCVHLLTPLLRRSGRAQLVGVVLMLIALRIYFFALPARLDAADELAASMEPARELQGRLAPTDTMLFLPLAPHGYLAERRQPGSFYTSFLPWHADIPGAEDRIIADIEQRKVAAIVVEQDAMVWEKYRLREYAPRLMAHIMTAYRPLDGNDRRRARIFVRASP